MLNNFEFELYLIRHGESEVNAVPDQMGQAPDVALTKKGKHQAQLLKEKFDRDGTKFDYVFASPYKRAYDTAKIVVGDQSIIQSPRLREYDAGRWTGISRKETLTKDVKYKMNCLNHDFLPPDGESLSMVGRRTSEWLEDVILYHPEMHRAAQEKKLNNESMLTIAAFSHGMAIKTLLQHIMGFDKGFTWKVSISNTAVCRLWFTETGWGLGSINDCSHLSGQEFDIYCPEVTNGS